MNKILVLEIMVLVLFLSMLPVTGAAYQGDGIVEPGESSEEELRRAAQNPVADLISFPIQNNTNFKYGPREKTQNITNIQPVVPFHLSEDWMMISRTVAPLVSQPAFREDQDREFGLGDIQQAVFLSPRKTGRFLWGAGPVLLLDTATDDRLGTGKWSAGPSAVGLTIQPPWVFGALVQNIWSFAGDSDRDDVNQFLFQYFVNYNLPNGWYLTSSPVVTANWEADSDNTWTIPFGGGVGRLFRIGKLPINSQVQGFYNVEKPDDLGPVWTLRFQVQVLLPK